MSTLQTLGFDWPSLEDWQKEFARQRAEKIRKARERDEADPLFFKVAKKGDIETLAKLIGEGANVNQLDAEGNTPVVAIVSALGRSEVPEETQRQYFNTLHYLLSREDVGLMPYLNPDVIELRESHILDETPRLTPQKLIIQLGWLAQFELVQLAHEKLKAEGAKDYHLSFVTTILCPNSRIPRPNSRVCIFQKERIPIYDKIAKFLLKEAPSDFNPDAYSHLVKAVVFYATFTPEENYTDLLTAIIETNPWFFLTTQFQTEADLNDYPAPYDEDDERGEGRDFLQEPLIISKNIFDLLLASPERTPSRIEQIFLDFLRLYGLTEMPVLKDTPTNRRAKESAVWRQGQAILSLWNNGLRAAWLKANFGDEPTPVTASPFLSTLLDDKVRMVITGEESSDPENSHRVLGEYSGMVATFL